MRYRNAIIRTSKARKDYRCDKCNGVIVKGTEYHSFNGWDGKPRREHKYAVTSTLAPALERCIKKEKT